MKIRNFAILLFAAMLSSVAFAQGGYVTVTATVPNYYGGQATASFQNQSSAPQLPLLNGSTFATTAVGNMNGSGKFTLSLADNLIIQPTPSQWQIIICSKPGNPSQPCYPVTLTITCVGNPSCSNGTLDISSAFSGAPAPPLPPGSLPIASNPGQILTSTSPGPNYALQPQIYYAQTADTISSIETQCSSACTYVVTKPQIITLSANHTLSSNVNLEFTQGGSWAVNGSSFTLTIPGNVNGTLSQHFSGTAAVQFGLLQNTAPPEWFGAAADWNGTTGTDNKNAFQATVNALSAGVMQLTGGQYMMSGTVFIRKSQVGIRGAGISIVFPTLIQAGNNSTTVVLTSASANAFEVDGTNASSAVGFNKISDFAIRRTVMPTNTAYGIALNYTYGVAIERMDIEENGCGIYAHAAGSSGVGYIENSVMIDGYGSVSYTGATGMYSGICLDSTDGQQSPSFRIRHSHFTNNPTNIGSATTAGINIFGNSINDQMVYGFEIAHAGYGVYINVTGGGSAIGSQDLHFYGSIFDDFKVAGFYINNAQSPQGSRIEINGGWISSPVANLIAVDVEASNGVEVTNAQIGQPGSNMQEAIFFHNSASCAAVGNMITNVTQNGIALVNSNSNVVSSNSVSSSPTGETGGLVVLENSSQNSVGLNQMLGAGSSATGLFLDSTSLNNTGLDTNAFSGAFTAAVAASAPFHFDFVGSTAPPTSCQLGNHYTNTGTITGTFPFYVCKNGTYQGLGTAY